MRLRSLLLIAGTALSFLTSAQAVTINATGVASYNFPGVFEIFTNSEFSSGSDRAYYELVNTGATMTATITLLDIRPPWQTINYAVYGDTNTDFNAIATNSDALATAAITLADVPPYFTFLMETGKQYILELARNSNGTGNITTGVSAVPLPGAIWLFGSALIGFMGWFSRRKR